MKIVKEYYVCTNADKTKFMDEHGSFGDIMDAIWFYTKEDCKYWLKQYGIETAKPLKMKGTFVFR